MKSLNLSYTENTGVGTVVHVAVDGKYAGYILISDVIKDGAKEAIASLKNSGVKKCVMLTGDSKTVAEHVAGELKLDEVHSELLPADKVSCVEKLLQDKSEKENWHSWVTVSTMHRYFPVRISVSPWEPLAQMRPLRQRMWF